jgi:hypothetical protein
MARWNEYAAGLLRHTGTFGSGGPIWDLFSPPEGADQAHIGCGTPSGIELLVGDGGG